MSYPAVGKHVAFDGAWLHAAPSDLAAGQPGRGRPGCAKRTRRRKKHGLAGCVSRERMARLRASEYRRAAVEGDRGTDVHRAVRRERRRKSRAGETARAHQTGRVRNRRGRQRSLPGWRRRSYRSTSCTRRSATSSRWTSRARGWSAGARIIENLARWRVGGARAQHRPEGRSGCSTARDAAPKSSTPRRGSGKRKETRFGQNGGGKRKTRKRRTKRGTPRAEFRLDLIALLAPHSPPPPPPPLRPPPPPFPLRPPPPPPPPPPLRLSSSSSSSPAPASSSAVMARFRFPASRS